MAEKSSTLFVKNMVCQRCVMTVENIFNSFHISFNKVSLGEVQLEQKISEKELKEINEALHKVGFELIDSRVNKIIEDIKQTAMEYLNLGMDSQNLKLSSFITNKIPYDYSYLSDLFSSIEGKTIEQYFILQRIEKVKELLVYDHLQLSEIAWKLGYSSVAHLSGQFKKITGFTPSDFKKLEEHKKVPIDKLT